MDYLSTLQKTANQTTTENGATTYSTSLNPCLDFFALGAAKRHDLDGAVQLFANAFAVDITTAVRTLFYIRDIREGQGERAVFRACLSWLADNDPKIYASILRFVPEYGRWDDVLTGKQACEIELIRTQLLLDEQSEHPSLLAKWLPSENASSPATRKKARGLAKALGLSPAEYRKKLSRLRRKIHLLEHDMSARRWDKIEYDTLPSQAFRKHTRAFHRHDEERFNAYLQDVQSGKKTLNTSTVTTAEVMQNVRSGDDYSINAIWKSLENFVPKDLNAIVVADVSGSMWGRPLDISTSLALYFAERNQGYFANKFITFSDRPQLVEVMGDNLATKLRCIRNADWGGTTNIEATFEVLLSAAKLSNDFEHIPKVIYIISDMEFDTCATGVNETALENARRKWNEAGLELPTVVFWNVDARSDKVPATKFDKNVVLVSGSSQSIFRYTMEGKTPEQVMYEILESDRYRCIDPLMDEYLYP